jgi:hypothetical protein
MSDSTHDLLRRCSELSARLFRQRRGAFQTVLFLTETTDGVRERFETSCVAPDAVYDATALAALRDELAEDFSRARIARFAVAFAGRVTRRGLCLLQTPPTAQRLAVAVEAHDIYGVHVQAVRDVAWDARGRPYLTAAEKVETIDSGQYGCLLAAVHEDAMLEARP